MTTSATTKRPRLTNFQEGQIWLMDDPVRIVRVEGPTTIESVDRLNENIQVSKAVKATATIPCVVIDGYVTDKVAAIGRKLKSAIQGANFAEADIVSDEQWTEIWAERTAYEIGHVPRGIAAQIDERRPYIQVYCHETYGRLPIRKRTSPIQGKQITGQLIPAEIIPPGLFSGETGRITPDVLEKQLQGKQAGYNIAGSALNRTEPADGNSPRETEKQLSESSENKSFTPPVQQLSDQSYIKLDSGEITWG